jgi:hypothetical protein
MRRNVLPSLKEHFQAREIELRTMLDESKREFLHTELRIGCNEGEQARIAVIV